MADPRSVAAGILLDIEIKKAYSALSLSDALSGQSLNDPRDRAFVSGLVYGVLDHKLTLDHNISLYLTSKLSRLHPEVLTVLRIGALQILYLDKIPDSAAVNEAVRYIKKSKCSYASGLVNAVLRKISANGLIYPEDDGSAEYLAVRYSVPAELVKHFIRYYGREEALSVLSLAEGRRPVFIRVNSTKTTEEGLAGLLSTEDAGLKKTALPNCCELDFHGDITSLSAFKEGLFHVQDMSSQLCCAVVSPAPGTTFVDCCAAPGGKSFTCAELMENKGTVISCDVFEHKTKLIGDGAERLGLSCIKTVCGDARLLSKTVKDADTVLCDVPCSGFGVLGRKPEIRYKDINEAYGLPALQTSVLESCSSMVRSGGVLVYSTCTLDPKENEEVCLKFLSAHKEFEPEEFCIPGFENSADGFLTVFPSTDGGDGFFIAKFRRKK